MILATYNINSVRARLPNLLNWLAEAKPDAVLLQEIKCEAADFPALELKAAGYDSLIKGQKAYHGVALLSRTPATLVKDTLDDGEARYLEASLQGLRLINIYAPNGNPLGSEKFPYKLGWLAKLETRLKELLAEDIPFLVGGDFNIIPEELDSYSPPAWANDALFQPESRAAYRRLKNLGLYDAYRALHPTKQDYTFWDYQGGAWPQNHGIRIDHFLLSPPVADRLLQCNIDKAPRGLEKASDHTPLILTLS